MTRRTPIALLAALVAGPAAAERLLVDPDVGNNVFTAVFDARLGERITAQSSSVSCDLVHDEAAGTVSGTCSVPLTRIRVDDEDTKTEHFRQWVTNRKSDPAACRLEARLSDVRVGKLAPGEPVSFAAAVPFTACGRARADGGAEQVKGTALLFPPGAYGERKTIRIRATVQGFDRDAYGIGPRHTEGWLARAQSLAKVVAEQGTVEISLFATPRDEAARAR
jgi:hypothetical protein